MASSPIDLSAGLVPKQSGSIDLSAGLVPKSSPSVHPTPENPDPNQPGMQPEGSLKKAWDWFAKKPILDNVLPEGTKTGDIIRAAVFQHFTGTPYVPGINDFDTMGDVHKDDSPARAAVRKFVAGAGKDTADMGAGFTTPAAIATMGAGAASKSVGAVGTIGKVISGASAAGFGAQGANDVYDAGTDTTPEAWQKRLQGGAMMAGGAAGAGEVLREPIAAVAPTVAERLKKSATEQYQQALNPTKERTKFMAQKRTPEMLDRGITADSAGALRDTAQEKATVATKELNDVYESLPGDRKSPTAPMVQALEDWKNQFIDRIPMTKEAVDAEIRANKGKVPSNIVKNADGTFDRVVNLDEHAINAGNALQETLKAYGDNITPRSMRKARQIFDESVARSGGYEGRSLAEGSMLDARKEAATAIRQQLAKDNPELVQLNSEISFWLDVQKIAAETAKRKVGQQGGLIVPMAKNAGRTIGAGTGFAIGGPAGGAAGLFIGGKLAENLAKVTRSTKWRTVSAVTKNRVADAIANGNFRNAEWELQFIGRQIGVPLAAVAAGSENPTDQPQE